MTIDLMGPPPRMSDKVVARPCFRICVCLDGGVVSDDSRAIALQVHDAFSARFDSGIHFLTIGTNPSRPFRAIKATAAKREDLRDALVGTADNETAVHTARLYGTNENPLGVPHMPYLSIAKSGGMKKLLDVELALPWDMPDLRDFADYIHTIVGKGRIRFGYQGFGFHQSSMALGETRLLPHAFNRFRAALMGAFNSAPLSTLFKTDAQVKRWGDYKVGISDVGWRTYVGNEYADQIYRLKHSGEHDVLVQENSRFACVTAGPAPIWGDINAGENIGNFTQSYEILRPAFADTKAISRSLWGDRDADEKEASRGYINRLSKGAQA